MRVLFKIDYDLLLLREDTRPGDVLDLIKDAKLAEDTGWGEDRVIKEKKKHPRITVEVVPDYMVNFDES